MLHVFGHKTNFVKEKVKQQPKSFKIQLKLKILHIDLKNSLKVGRAGHGLKDQKTGQFCENLTVSISGPPHSNT